MPGKSLFRVAFILFFLLCIPVANILAQKEVKAYFFDPTQIGQGQTLTLHVAGDKFYIVQSVQIEPAGGITVGEIKVHEKMEKATCWAVELAAAKDATLGKRAITVQTTEGVIKKNIEILPQPIPIISNLKIQKATRELIQFTFEVQHEPGSLGKKLELAFGYKTLLLGFITYLIKTDKIELIDSAHSTVQAIYSVPGQALGSYWLVRVQLKDSNKHWSNMLETRATF